ncbi:MAG: P-loop containing nucleoside triphosphate hydrolase protein [Benjaminiella poitrasii]|nr:MAG: P-loop containing nucleoside triphosphate hydrolase protein [Benjaminiella poitrasii]
MSNLVKHVKGPSEWVCKNGKDCWYNEYSTLVTVFPNNIQLSCDVGECANEQDFFDIAPIEQEFSSYTEMMIIGALFIASILLFGITKLTASRQKKLFGTRVELLDEDSDDGLLTNSREVTLSFSDISYSVSSKTILTDISGYVLPGQMLAVMGPSGAGKSSLLDILSRKHKRGVAAGKILMNGVIPTRRQFKRLTGFVDQDDSLMRTLTVRETLTYAALMRLPRTMSLRAKQKRVEDVIQELGLTKIADSKVGVAGQRGISGGEKRRVSIGKELVTSPSLLFLDEPTSGLDAYNAGVVMECLQKLAHDGKRTIIVTIHQPRSNIFKMFDSLMLLTNGQLAYFGPASSCSTYFKDLGFPVPTDYNIADYLIDLTMKRPEDAVSRPNTPIPSGRSQIDVVTQPLEDIHTPYISVTEDDDGGGGESEFNLLSEANHTHYLIDSYRSSDLYKSVEHRLGRSENEDNSNDAGYSVWVDASGQDQTTTFSIYQFYHELSLLSSRTFINLYRNPFLFFAHFAFSVILAILLGTLFWQVDVDLSGVQNRLGVLFFMCALLGFAATSALDMFNQERILFMRERENGYYSPSAYFVAKVLFDIVPLRVLPPIVMGSICYYMIGLNSALTVFGKFLLVLVLFNLAAAGLCLCFATAFKNLSVANLMANLVILFSMLFGGFLLNKDHIPHMLSWLQHLSFFNYGYEALIVNELKDITLRDKSIADIQIPGPIILARFGFNGQAFWTDVHRLVWFILFTLTLSFLFLKHFVKERR